MRKIKYDLIVSDFDGTLVCEDGTISNENKKAIAEYIRNQLQEDLAYEQMSIKELIDPFTGEPVRASKK